MHSKKKNFPVWTLAFALIAGGAHFARADGEVTEQDRKECLDEKDPPARGSNFEKDAVRFCRLSQQVARLRKQYRDASDEAAEVRVDGELQTILPEYRQLRRKLNRSGRKLRNAEKKEARVEKLENDIEELEASKEGKSAEEIADIDSRIDAIEGRIRAKNKAIARKERKYTKITGDLPPSKVPSPVPSAVPPPKKELSREERMKLVECWEKGEQPLERTVTAYFPVGQSEIKTGSMYDYEHKVFDLFAKQAREVAKEFNDAGYRVYKVEASSRESKIGSSGRKPASLNAKRSASTASAFFAAAKVGDPAYLLEALDLEPSVDATPEGQTAIGPAAPKQGYHALAAKKLSDKQREVELRKAADAIQAGKDPTPVRGESVEQTLENLRACCDSNLGSIQYQPYQYTTLTFYGAKFAPESDACVAKSEKVANGAGLKDVGGEDCDSRVHGNCDAYQYDAGGDGKRTKQAN